MNRCDYLDPGLCWTGVKDSGVGVSLSKFGFDAVRYIKDGIMEWNSFTIPSPLSPLLLQLTRPKSYHLRVAH